MNTKETLTVQECDILHCTPNVGSIIHPAKGRLLFATKSIKKGDVIMRVKTEDYALHLLPNIDEYKEYLQSKENVEEIQHCLQHTIPTGEGKLLVPVASHWFNFANHSNNSSSIDTSSNFFTEDDWDIFATRDIEIGDEICTNYTKTVGYESRDDMIIREFLELWGNYNVEKRPSKLTFHNVKVVLKCKL